MHSGETDVILGLDLSPWDEVLMEGPFIDLCELAPELDRRADA